LKVVVVGSLPLSQQSGFDVNLSTIGKCQKPLLEVLFSFGDDDHDDDGFEFLPLTLPEGSTGVSLPIQHQILDI
jgi:hypothetical protein